MHVINQHLLAHIYCTTKNSNCIFVFSLYNMTNEQVQLYAQICTDLMP